MKYRYLLLLLIAVIFSTADTSAQLVGGSGFAQGHWLEAGVAPNGAWGNNAVAPAGYHTRGGSFVSYPGTPGGAEGLDFSYDANHDGWTVGPDLWYGAFFLPGTPFDGWSMQVNGVRSNAYYNDGGFYNDATGTLTGSVTGYQYLPALCTPTPSRQSVTWTGSAGIGSALQITQTNTLDTEASWLVVTTKFVNTSAVDQVGVYYFVTGDPDNDEVLSGDFRTNNHIVYQGDAENRHEVCARPLDAPRQDAFSGLATKDCRAKALIYQSWPPITGTAGNNLDLVWSETATGMGGTYYDVGKTTLAEDIAYGLIYNLGTIRAHDSTILSFAWIFSDTLAIDSAFPHPQIATEGVAHALRDTVIGCTMNGCGVLNINQFNADIVGGDEKDWSFSKWTWSPAAGLSATTGTHVTVDITHLGGITTFTITGTKDVAHGQCGTQTLYLYVVPCFSASSNSPGPEGTPWAPDPGPLGTIDFPGPGWGRGTGGLCLYDTLRLAAHGDSTGATYFWYGPGGFTSIQQYTQRLPAMSMADTGWYYVVKTVGPVHDTAKTFVMFNPTPIVTATTNAPICSGTTLNLFANPDSTTETFAWSGPQGFTSTDQNPTIAGVPVKDSGIYKVITTLYNCVDSGFVHVAIDSAPVVPNVWNNSPGAPIGPSICQGDTLRLFAADSTPGVTYGWTGPVSFLSVDQNPVIYNVLPSASGVYTVTATLDICLASAVTTVSITPTPILIATNNGPVCTGVEDTLLLQAVSVPGATYTWTGPYVFYSLNQNPYRTPVSSEYEGIYQVTAMAGGCKSATVNDTVVIRKTPKTPIVPWLTYCQYFNAPVLQAMGDSILWYPSGAAHGIGTLDAPTPSTDAIGVTWFYVSQTLMSCTSAIDSIRVSIIPRPTLTLTENTEICPHDTAVITASSNEAIAYYHWFPPTYLSDTSAATVIVRPENNVHYTVVLTNKFGCTDTGHANVNVYAGAVISLGDSVSLYPGESYHISPQTNCVTFAWFPPAGLDNAGIADPTATPQISTKYIVRAETSWGCKVKDSINIYIDPEASLAMPNAFTPGATGTNSEFKIIKRGLASLKYFRIWDRWGVKVFETTDIDQGWNGTLNGKPQPFGVYIYEVSAETNTGRAFIKHGNVTLVR